MGGKKTEYGRNLCTRSSVSRAGADNGRTVLPGMTPLKERKKKSIWEETLTQSTLERATYPSLLSTCLLCDEANGLSLIAMWN